MLTADPPVHTRYRRLVSKAFTPRRVAELGPAILEICEGLVDAFTGASVDLVTAYCVPIPTKTVATALGVPQERYSDFKRWADAGVAAIGRELDDQGWLDSVAGVVEMQQYFAAELERRREQPADDLLTDLLAARLTPDDGMEGEPLSMPELISIVQQLQVAGSETTASLIADAVVMLHERPELWQRLADQPESANEIVEECLRLSSPNLGMFRVATADARLGGVDIPAGSTLWVLFGSANRDGSTFGDDADEIRTGRPEPHLAFGKGVHFCVGAPLARLEAVTALQVLARRFRAVRPTYPDGLRYAPSCILRGLTSLPVQLVPRNG
jgi:cytochrome P450